MGPFIAFLYGIASYVVFFATFLYAIGFVTGLIVPKTIDTGVIVPTSEALVVDLLLMSVFAIQHSVMARQQFKQWWTKFVPKSVERSTYVLFSSLALILLCAMWRPMPTVIWRLDDPLFRMAMTALSFTGFLIVLSSTFLINHFELFGLHQVTSNLNGGAMPVPRFRTPLYYKLVRHPHLPGIHYRILGHSGDDSGPSVVRGRHQRLHRRRHSAGGTRPHRSVWRRVSKVQAPRVDVGSLAQVGRVAAHPARRRSRMTQMRQIASWGPRDLNDHSPAASPTIGAAAARFAASAGLRPWRRTMYCGSL